MFRELSLIALLAALPLVRLHADPIHAKPDGAYWHHGSGWTFPERVGGYVRVGIPQDVAGSEDAVAYYALEVDGARRIASVDVYPANSAAAALLEAPLDGPLISETQFPLNALPAAVATRHVYSLGETTKSVVALYIVSAGDWRVRICITGPELSALDAFVTSQHWDNLGRHSGISDSSMTSSAS